MKKLLMLMVCVLLLAGATWADNRPPSRTAMRNPRLLQELLEDWFAGFDDSWFLFLPSDSAPDAAEGKVYYNDTANALYVCTDGSTWTALESGASQSLDTAYDSGNKIDVDGTVLELEVDDGSNNAALLLDMDDSSNNPDVLQITNAGTGDAISINGASTGNLIYDEDGNFTVASTGALTAATVTSAGDVVMTGTSKNIQWDSSENTLEILDDSIVAFGTGDDATLKYDETTSDALELEAAAADTAFTIGGTSAGFDITYYFETAGTIATDYDGDSMTFSDSMYLKFGSSGDVTIAYDGSGNDLDILGSGKEVSFGVTDEGMDVVMHGETSGEYFMWDESADSVLANCGNVSFVTTDAEVNQIVLNATGTGAGEAINVETTNGGINIEANDGTNGDITIDAADDMTLTAAGNLTLAVTGTVSAGGSAITNLYRTVELFVDDDVLLAAESGKLCVSDGNDGGVANVILTLPTAAAGIVFTFADANATGGDDLYIKAGASDTINGGSAAEYLACKTDSAGQSVTLEAIDETRWIITAVSGTWVADDSPD